MSPSYARSLVRSCDSLPKFPKNSTARFTDRGGGEEVEVEVEVEVEEEEEEEEEWKEGEKKKRAARIQRGARRADSSK